jgi:hypothetical protein
MSFVVLFALGTRIDQHHIRLFVDLFFDPGRGYGRIVSGNFHVFGETV